MRRFSVLVATLALSCHLSSVASAQQRRSADQDVYTPFQTPGLSTGRLQAFDADWTADGKLAIAFAEQGPQPSHSNVMPSIDLVVGIHDPAAGTWQLLGRFGEPAWAVEGISLSVPGAVYGNSEKDRVYVAVKLRAYHRQLEQNGLTVQAIRLVSAALDGSENELRLASEECVPMQQTSSFLAVETPSVTLTPAAPWTTSPDYAVDLAFTDPNGQHVDIGSSYVFGHLMASRSTDYGQKLECARYLTGPCACEVDGLDRTAQTDPGGTQPSIAADDLTGQTLLAFQNESDRRVHVIARAYTESEFTHFWSSPEQDPEMERSPRIACGGDGHIVVTALSPPSPSSTSATARWWAGNFAAGLLERPSLRDRVSTRVDVEVRNNDAFMSAAARVDQSSSSRPAFFESSVANSITQPAGAWFLDDDAIGRTAPVIAAPADAGWGWRAYLVIAERAPGDDPVVVMDHQ